MKTFRLLNLNNVIITDFISLLNSNTFFYLSETVELLGYDFNKVKDRIHVQYDSSKVTSRFMPDGDVDLYYWTVDGDIVIGGDNVMSCRIVWVFQDEYEDSALYNWADVYSIDIN